MGEVPTAQPDDETITHGICSDCMSNLKFQTGTTLKNLLDDLNAPILVLGRDGVIELSNRSAKDLLGKEAMAIEGHRPGDVFECSHARLPEGCGRTLCCSGCTIRRTVLETQSTGRSLNRAPACLKHGYAEHSAEVQMHISTEKVGEVVFLRIDDIETDREP
jgi:hypothetical protein